LILVACESFNTVHVGAEGLQQEGECYTGRLFIWADGSMRRESEDWIFPSINFKTMWDMWYKGDRSKEIGPFRFLTQKDIKDKKNKVQLSRARGVMDKLTNIAKEYNYTSSLSAISKFSVSEFDEIFDKCFKIVMGRDPNDVEAWDGREHCQPEEISYGTVYNTMRKEKRKR
jgi:hypothetical protein